MSKTQKKTEKSIHKQTNRLSYLYVFFNPLLILTINYIKNVQERAMGRCKTNYSILISISTYDNRNRSI